MITWTWSSRLAVIAVLLGASCDDLDDSSDDADGSDAEMIESLVAPTGSLLVSGDFAATSKTKTIVTQEIAAHPTIQLLPVGDLSYSTQYNDGYPWIPWLSRTYPVIGNHEINCTKAGDVCGREAFALFDGNNAAGNHHFPAITGGNGKPTYDFTYTHELAPGWLLVVLNTGTNCKQQSCTSQASQLTSWVNSYRAAHAGHGCVIVALHTARWSTMFSSSDDNLPWATSVAPIWNAAVAAKVDLVMQGHVHVYEEFAKLDANGHAAATGTKLFTMGSGGRGQVKPPQSNIASSVLLDSAASPVNGVLKLALYNGSYGYHFERALTAGMPASSVPCNVP